MKVATAVSTSFRLAYARTSSSPATLTFRVSLATEPIYVDSVVADNVQGAVCMALDVVRVVKERLGKEHNNSQYTTSGSIGA
ncbi:unnamed protein product [Hydatigera taeniaeformis]|uniref:LeuA_dimer domain-containing protein n=1 Tax=Hydatigena taeniaeformis TaxID=6205 RepID=A0A0R3XAK0_HYDTA|nr:unnamed protein product [Hydatigera taeniaeformis]